jgi:threonine dehydratase
MIPYNWITDAAVKIQPHIKQTPLTYDPNLDLYIKWENQQVTGSFKARGAFNKVLSLEKWEQEAGLLAASAGNHGQGLALAGSLVGAPVKIFVGETAPEVKIEAMRNLGAEIVVVPGGYGEAENAALKMAANSSATWVSAYNDGTVIAGQGTVGLEMTHQLATFPDLILKESTWLVPVSGGGLLAGVGAALAELSPRPRLIGVQADTNAFMQALFNHGSQADVVEKPTIADGLAGPVEAGSITIPLIKSYVDDIILVTEAEIAAAVIHAWQVYQHRIEGAAAVSLAAVLSGHIPQKPVVALISGGNIQPEVFEQILAEQV